MIRGSVVDMSASIMKRALEAAKYFCPTSANSQYCSSSSGDMVLAHDGLPLEKKQSWLVKFRVEWKTTLMISNLYRSPTDVVANTSWP
ncbi:hypothetical protein Hypma_012686 [Hypsizygus marmoreus]|uniref:Uncharacterized protein n=1 Tax=Hypsizygus marmoreus TaxID=39966 RepID=A0A369JGD8_HYPMA|nr:hypothetical protein Hypma_012686 [Hypsizygus marmoreus]